METKILQNKEQAILEAAEQEFLAKGFDGARTASIARTAGVTHAMLHYYFHTKEQLFDRILEKIFGQISEILSDIFVDNEPISYESIERLLNFVTINPALPLFLIREFHIRPKHFAGMHSQAERLINVLAQRIEQKTALSTQHAQAILFECLILVIAPCIAFPLLSSTREENRVKILEQFKITHAQLIKKYLKQYNS